MDVNELPAIPAAPTAAPATRHALSFHGAGLEYARIWYVNLLLTVVTLGIYSAWAKVRNLQYFHANTQLDGSPFGYHGDPKAILRGRLVVVGVYLALAILSELVPALAGLALLAILALLPWALSRSLRFRALNTSYRNLRFDFLPDYGQAYVLLFMLVLFVPLTLGLAYPWWRAMLMRYMARHRFGRTDFSFAVHGSAVFGYYAVAAAMLVGVFVLIGVAAAMGPLASALAQLGNMGEQSAQAAGIAGAVIVWSAILLFFLFVAPYLDSRLTNLFWNNVRIGPVRIESRLRARDLLWLRVSNGLLLVFTLFLAWPWTLVRNARYRASRTAVVGDLSGFLAGESMQVSALGEEIGDLLDVDIAL